MHKVLFFFIFIITITNHYLAGVSPFENLAKTKHERRGKGSVVFVSILWRSGAHRVEGSERKLQSGKIASED